jgi:predicted ATPase
VSAQPAVPHNVPAALTSLVGRDDDLAAVCRLLAEGRYVTLTGPGGAGKTRLTREVAARAAGAAGAADADASHSRDGEDRAELAACGGAPFEGVWWVELAPLAAGADVAPAVAGVLGVNAPAGRTLPGAIAEAAGGRRLLLVLDNCEHVLEPCAALVDTLLRACPRLVVLASSRGALGGEGERVWQLPRLSHPPPAPQGATAWAETPNGLAETEAFGPDALGPDALARYASVRLFVARAQAADSRFALTAQNAPAVRAVCARVEGLPLALELAGGRRRGARRRAGGGAPGRRLSPCSPAADARRRRATARSPPCWTGATTSSAPPSGGCSRDSRCSVPAVPLEAVEAVGGAPGDDAEDGTGGPGDALVAFATLVDHSLVDVGERGGEPHYRLLETVRQYAAVRLRAAPADEAATRRRHAR